MRSGVPRSKEEKNWSRCRATGGRPPGREASSGRLACSDHMVCTRGAAAGAAATAAAVPAAPPAAAAPPAPPAAPPAAAPPPPAAAILGSSVRPHIRVRTEELCKARFDCQHIRVVRRECGAAWCGVVRRGNGETAVITPAATRKWWVAAPSALPSTHARLAEAQACDPSHLASALCSWPASNGLRQVTSR